MRGKAPCLLEPSVLKRTSKDSQDPLPVFRGRTVGMVGRNDLENEKVLSHTQTLRQIIFIRPTFR